MTALPAVIDCLVRFVAGMTFFQEIKQSSRPC